MITPRDSLLTLTNTRSQPFLYFTTCVYQKTRHAGGYDDLTHQAHDVFKTSFFGRFFIVGRATIIRRLYDDFHQDGFCEMVKRRL